MTTIDSYFVVFIGILVANIVYQTGLIQKMYNEISNLKIKMHKIEDKLNVLVKK